MRTIALFAMTGIIAAAQTPKPAIASLPPARLNTAEIVAFTAVESRMKALRDEFAELEKQRGAIKSDACQRTVKEADCDIQADGTVHKMTPPAPAKPEVKK